MNILIKTTHHHIAGGGENCFFKILSILQKEHNVQVVSDQWLVEPDKSFGISISNNINLGQNIDIFINYSHSELADPIGKYNIAHVFYPQYDWSEKIKKYDKVVTISEFSKKEIKRKWGVDAEIVYPATDLKRFKNGIDKEKQILSVGRFFWIEDGNNKNQHFMVEAFKKLPKDWKLILVGYIQNQEYFDKVKKLAEGYNIEFLQDLPFEKMVDLYAESKVYWHAAGYQAKYPSSCEHFGIVAVEALASGCITLVHNSGGIAEINGVKTWENLDELAEKTLKEKFVEPDLYKYSIEGVAKKWKEILKNASI